jgi:CheY-like chemotaxis protein
METDYWITGNRVLIVDDEDVIAITLSQIFRSFGYETRTADSAEEAVGLLESWKPDVALVDVYLPGMNGVDLGIYLRCVLPQCKVLLTSGHPGSGELRRDAARIGHAMELIAKPVHPRVLLDCVAELLDSARIQDIRPGAAVALAN